MAEWWEADPLASQPTENWWRDSPVSEPAQQEPANDLSLWRQAQKMARQYANDVLTGQYARQGVENLTGAYRWDPNISALENARRAARDPAAIGQATNIAMALTPAPVAAVKPPKPPTAVQLKEAGSAKFTEARDLGIEFRPDAIKDMALTMRSALDSKGFISERAPETHAIINRLANPPSHQGGSTVSLTTDGLQAIREAFSSIRQSSASATERAAANRAIRGLDSFIEAGNPAIVVPGTGDAAKLGALVDTWKEARGNWAASQRSNDITGALDRANTGVTDRAAARAAAANSGTNIDNALRQRVASFLQNRSNVSGYADAELEALQRFVEGSFGRNRLRDAANFMGGGRGMLGALWTALGGAAGAGATAGSPWGAAVGAVTPMAIGGALKAAQNRSAMNSIGAIDDMLRSRSPLYETMLQNPALPALDKQALLLRMMAAGGQSAPQMWGTLAPPER